MIQLAQRCLDNVGPTVCEYYFTYSDFKALQEDFSGITIHRLGNGFLF